MSVIAGLSERATLSVEAERTDGYIRFRRARQRTDDLLSLCCGRLRRKAVEAGSPGESPHWAPARAMWYFDVIKL